MLVHFDAMHCLGRFILVVVVEVMMGVRWRNPNMRKLAVAVCGGGQLPLLDADSDMGPGQLDDASVKQFVGVLQDVSNALPASTGLRRLAHLFSPSKSNKHHALLSLASPVGLYALHKVKAAFTDQHVYDTMQRALAVVNILWAKEVHQRSLNALYQLTAEMLAMMEAYMPAYLRDINQHEVLELVESIPHLGAFWFSVIPTSQSITLHCSQTF
jgi:hypothetical protein